MTEVASVPAEIQPLLNAYVSATRHDLSDLVSAVYLQGSIALDEFNPRFSDIDFIAVLTRPAVESELAALARIHADIKQQFPTWQLEGTYVQSADFSKPVNQIGPAPHYHDGKFDRAATHTTDDVTWWVLKTRGIALFGPDPRGLSYYVNWDDLSRNMRHNLNSYWRGFTTNPARITWLLTDYGIQWAVLGVLRQYYTFCEHDITSKSGAGEYALKRLPSRWHKIIQESLNNRAENPQRLYGSAITRAFDAWQFMRYIIAEANKLSE
jgi:hypothetical protein